jgi:hypothetical protein
MYIDDLLRFSALIEWWQTSLGAKVVDGAGFVTSHYLILRLLCKPVCVW